MATNYDNLEINNSENKRVAQADDIFNEPEPESSDEIGMIPMRSSRDNLLENSSRGDGSNMITPNFDAVNTTEMNFMSHIQ